MATYDFSNAIPYVPTHVGELINDELVASGLSVEQLSEKANIELIALNETISGKRQLSTEMALQIESVMGIPASLLLNIQIQYNSFLRRKSIFSVENYRFSNFPISLTKADMLYNTPAASQAGILPHYILFLIVPISRLAPIPCYV